jgi:hypothetical protein
MLGPYPGQDEESGVIDDQVEMLPALFVGPADVAITRCAHPGGGAEAEQGDGLLLRAVDDITQLRPGKGLVAKIVPAREITFPRLANALQSGPMIEDSAGIAF